MSIKKQGTYAVSQFHLQCKTNAIELTAAGPTVQVQERNSTDPRYPAKVTAVVKRVARYFEDHIEQPREQQQQPEATGDKDALDDSLSELQAYNPSTSASEREEEAVEDGGNTDDPQEGERRSSLVPLHVPDLWNATKAVDSEIDALELALRKMLDTKDSSFDFGAITNPYSIFQVRHTTPFARLAHRNHHFTATSTHPGRNSFFFFPSQFMLAKLEQLHMPLLTFKLESSFLTIAALVDPSERLEQYRTLLRTSVPSDCFQKIRALLPLMRRLEAHHERNGMTYARLGDVFMPVFIRSRMEKSAGETTREKYLARTLVRTPLPFKAVFALSSFSFFC
jgi:hypothetical protein